MRSNKKECRLVIPLLLAAALGLAPGTANAQYFGRNKVQYKTFKYEVLKTEHFDIYFYPEERKAVEQAGRMAERWYARLKTLFEHDLSGRQPIILYASNSDFWQTNVIEGQIGEGTGGVTEVLKRRVVLPFAGPLAETDHVLGHELVHAFQYDITSSYARANTGGLPSAVALPTWFIEGMAEYFSIGPIDANTAMWLRDATRRNELPTIKQLNDTGKYFPYRYGQALLAYIGGRWDDKTISKLLKEDGGSEHLERVIKKVLGISEEQLGKEWHECLHKAYDTLVADTKEPTAYAERLIAGKERTAHSINVGPVLSPDGKRLLFFSTRDLFSIDLFLADANTGEITRRLTKTATDAHFNSLGFISSAGAFEPKGRLLAFAALSNCRPELVLLDVERDRIEREIPLSDLEEIYTPTWSPDGEQIAFSANAGGLVDLFLYDLKSNNLRRMTNDLYSELMPAWSPKGSQIAFVTDRFGANLQDIQLGHYRLELMDPESGRIETVNDFPDGKNIDPQWSPDGKTLYFLSDQNGISNIYALDVATGERSQLTNLYTGVSGITDTSPALTVARDTGQIAFCVFENDDYNIYKTASGASAVGGASATSFGEPSPAILPPQDRAASKVMAMLRDSTVGMITSDSAFRIIPYKAHLKLDYIGQPFLVAGSDPLGTYLGGGTSLFFSDMLGEHNLATYLQVNGGFKDIGGAVVYQDRTHRWNWAGIVQQIPYLSGAFASGIADVNGEPALVEQVDKFRQTYTSVGGLLSYPFSTFERLEFSGGYNRIGFSQEIQTTAYSLITGDLILDTTEKLPSAAALDLVQTRASLVHDSSFFGATSPVMGERYNVSVIPYFGNINFTEALADYRRYFMPFRPYTIAGRILHYGRYGSGSEDNRITRFTSVTPAWSAVTTTTASVLMNACPTRPASVPCTTTCLAAASLWRTRSFASPSGAPSKGTTPSTALYPWKRRYSPTVEWRGIRARSPLS